MQHHVIYDTLLLPLWRASVQSETTCYIYITIHPFNTHQLPNDQNVTQYRNYPISGLKNTNPSSAIFRFSICWFHLKCVLVLSAKRSSVAYCFIYIFFNYNYIKTCLAGISDIHEGNKPSIPGINANSQRWLSSLRIVLGARR